MNTPSHIVINLALLDKSNNSSRVFPILLGTLLPDLPIFILFFQAKFIAGVPDRIIWEEIYFRDDWQLFIDIFNSIPIIVFFFLVAMVFLKGNLRYFLGLLFASMFLHALLDLPLHNDDAHRHFYPLSNWRFISPFSYWDIRYHAEQIVAFELALSIFACFVIIFRKRAFLPTVIGVLLIIMFVFYGWAFYGGKFDF